MLPSEDKPRIVERWAEFLRPGGVVVTTAMIGAPTTPELRAGYAERARRLLDEHPERFARRGRHARGAGRPLRALRRLPHAAHAPRRGRAPRAVHGLGPRVHEDRRPRASASTRRARSRSWRRRREGASRGRLRLPAHRAQRARLRGLLRDPREHGDLGRPRPRGLHRPAAQPRQVRRPAAPGARDPHDPPQRGAAARGAAHVLQRRLPLDGDHLPRQLPRRSAATRSTS